MINIDKFLIGIAGGIKPGGKLVVWRDKDGTPHWKVSDDGKDSTGDTPEQFEKWAEVYEKSGDLVK